MKSYINSDPTNNTEIDYPFFARSLINAHKYKQIKQILKIGILESNGKCDLNKLFMEIMLAMDEEVFLSKEEFEKCKKDIR